MSDTPNMSVAGGYGSSKYLIPRSSMTTTTRVQPVTHFVRKQLHGGEFKAIGTIIENIPTPTSTDELEELYKNVFAVRAIDQLLLDQALDYGMPFSFKFEQSGATVQNIFPIKSHAQDQISSSSATRLQMHTETAFHPKRPDYVFLYCLRPDSNAGTTLAHIGDIVSRLSKADIRVLQQPVFRITPDLSFIKSGADASERMLPVLNKSCTEITYDEETMVPTTGDAEVSLSRLQQAISAAMTTITLEQSEMLLIPNTQYIHGRTPFAARYDGSDRWLKRIMLRSFDQARTSLDGMTPIE